MSTALDESFRIDHPQPNDLVGDPLLVAGMGGGFEATIDIRILDGNGAVLLATFAMSTNLISAWHKSIDLPSALPTKGGVLEVGPSTGADTHPGVVSIPVLFGTAILPDYRSYLLYTVQSGDTLSGIAASQSGLYPGTGYGPIFEANRHVISDPDVIHPGTVLRIPSNF
jgi:nucleoid-associated protein YgaU